MIGDRNVPHGCTREFSGPTNIDKITMIIVCVESQDIRGFTPYMLRAIINQLVDHFSEPNEIPKDTIFDVSFTKLVANHPRCYLHYYVVLHVC